MFSIERNIESLIPQKKPFVMIDSLLYSDDQVTRSGYTIDAENIFVENGFFKEPGIVENMAQTAAVRAGYIARSQNADVPVGYIGSIKNLEIYSLPGVGEQLETEIIISNVVFDVTIITARVICRNVLVAKCEMKIFINN